MSLQVWLPLNGNIENLGICGDVTSTSTPEYTTGKLEKGVSLNKRVDFTGLPKLTNFSIFFWARVDSCTTSWSDLLGFTCKQSNDASAADFRFEATVETRACSWHNNSPFGISSGSRILIQNYEEWHHVGVVYDGENIYSYIDGELTYTDTGLGGYLTTNFHIGETGKFVGAMNDLRIYDECLSKEQIHQISQGLILHYPLNSGYGNENLMRMGGLNKNGATSMTYNSSTDTYTIVSPAGTNSWGYGVNIRSTSEISIPYGKSYRASVEVYVPTQHSFVVDINNNVANGTTVWAGNDNDNTSKRTSTSFTIPANTWKKISWGSENSNGNNTDKVAILPYDKLGLKTNSDTDSVTWYLRHPKIELGTSVTDWCPNKNDALYTTLGYDSTTVYDTSGFGNDGTMVNNIAHTSDTPLYDSSINLQKANSNYINLQNTYITNQSTINFWGKVNTFSGWQRFFEFCNVLQGATGNHRILLGTYQNTQQLGLHIYGGETGTTSLYVNSNITTIDTNWHMYSVVFNKTNLKVFMDGKSIVDATMTQELTSMVRQYSYIGKSSYSADSYFDGNISDFRIYSTALSAEDIKQLYQSKVRIDKSGNLYCNQFVEMDNERNLLDTDDYWISGQTSGTYKQEKMECSDSVSGTATKITCTAAGSGGFYMSGHKVFDKISLVNGKQYCISLYVKSDNRTSVEFNVECKSAQSKTRFTIGTEYRRLCIIYTYSNTTTHSAFTSYGGWKVNENIYIHSLKVTEYNPKSYIKNNSVIETNSFTEISSENETKIYKQDIQTNQIIEI